MKNITIIVLALALIVSIMFNVVNTITKADIIGIDGYSAEEVAQYVPISDENLAILISNKDYPVKFIDHVAKYNDHNSYNDAVNHLIDDGLLVRIPEYTPPEYGVMSENIVTPYTVGYKIAVEAGIIQEVK